MLTLWEVQHCWLLGLGKQTPPWTHQAQRQAQDSKPETMQTFCLHHNPEGIKRIAKTLL